MTHALHIALPQFQAFLVVLVRVGGIVAALPILGSRTIPHLVRLGLAGALALVVLPFAPPAALPDDAWMMVGGLSAEVLVGMVIGLAVRSLFAGVELAGELMGSQMGLSVVQLFDPTSAHQVPVLGHYQTAMASLLFLSLNAHLFVVQAVTESFRLVPPFGAALSASLVEDVVRVSVGLFAVGLKLAAPVVAVTMVVNVAMAMLGRAVAQINVFVLSFPVTIACGFLALGLSLPMQAAFYESEFIRLADTVQGLLQGLGHE